MDSRKLPPGTRVKPTARYMAMRSRYNWRNPPVAGTIMEKRTNRHGADTLLILWDERKVVVPLHYSYVE